MVNAWCDKAVKILKMRQEVNSVPGARSSALHQQALIVIGFFGGFAITALVETMRSQTTFHVAVWPLSPDEYFELLITVIAIVSSSCIFGSLSVMEVAGGTTAVGSQLDTFVYVCFLMASLDYLPFFLCRFYPI